MPSNEKASDNPAEIEFLTIEEVCDWLKISRKTLERYRKEDDLRSVKVGKSVRFVKKDVLEWIGYDDYRRNEAATQS